MSDLGCIVGVLSLFGLPGAVGSLRFTDTSSVYARGDETTANTVANVDTAPGVDLGLEWRRANLSLTYGPRLTLASAAGAGSPTLVVLHAGYAALDVAGARYRLRLGQTFSIGDLLIGNLAPPTAPAADPSTAMTAAPSVNLLPKAQLIHVRSEQSRVDLTYLARARLSSTTSASYGIQGGYGAESKKLQPRQHIARLGTDLGYTVREHHELVSGVAGTRASVSNGFEHWIASASETWSAQWTNATTTRLGLGAAWYRTTGPDGPSSGAIPTVSAALNYNSVVEGSTMDFQLSTAVTPNVNLLTGHLQTFAIGTFGVAARRNEARATLSANVAQSLPPGDSDATRTLGAAFEFSQGATDWLDVTLGGRFQKQYTRGPTPVQPLQWVATAGLSFHPRTWDF